MRTNSWRGGLGAIGVLVAVLACGETDKNSDAAETDNDSAGGSAGSGGLGGSGANGPATTGVTTSGVATNTVGTTGGTVSTTGGTTSSGTTSMGGAGGVGGSTGSDTSSSSVGGAGGGAGAPPITECLSCQTTTESFGSDDCQVWACTGVEGIRQLQDAGCQDLGTQIPRYCCPRDVVLDCE